MKLDQSNNQYSKLISFEHSGMHQVDWHFEDLEYLNTINIQYSEIPSNVNERIYLKLHPLELVIDVRFGRSTFHHFKSFHYYFALSTSRNYHHFLQVHTHLVEWIVTMEDLFKSIHSNSFNTFNYCW